MNAKLKKMRVVQGGLLNYKCDFCGDPAVLDSPAKDGRWANFCEKCIEPHACNYWHKIGSRLK